MREAKLLETREIPLDEIDTENRLRPVTVSAVESLVASIEQLGHMMDEIHVRRVRHQGGRLKLMAGGHRLAAAMALGWETIPAKIWDCTDDWAELLEIDDNLAQAELSMLELAVFMSARKQVYLKLHPETKRGGDHKSPDFQNQTELGSFCSTTAEKRGISERQVRKMVAAGESLTRSEVLLLGSGQCNPTLKDLITVAGLDQSSKLRHDVIQLLAEGNARTAAEAVHSLAIKKPPVDPIEQQHQNLLGMWKRAPLEARRRFLRDVAGDATLLLAKLGEAE